CARIALLFRTNGAVGIMLSYFRWYREHGWHPISAEEYRAAWQRWGGSVATHPDVVERLSDLAGIAVRYLGCSLDGELKAAIATWGRHLALAKAVLNQQKKRGVFDFGNAEIIVPQAADATVSLRHKGRYISELHAKRISTLKEQKEGLALAREPE